MADTNRRNSDLPADDMAEFLSVYIDETGEQCDQIVQLLLALESEPRDARRIAEAVGDPHLVARKWFKPAERPDLGLHSYNGFPWRFESFEPDIHIPPPRLGEHSSSVLREELGLIDTEIADLMSQGVTGTVF